MPPPNCKENDPAINDLEQLLRRIPPDHWDKEGVSYEAFNDIYCSVEVESKSSPEACLAHCYSDGFIPSNTKKMAEKLLKKGWGMGSIITSLPREKGQTVYFEPQNISIKKDTFINDAHALICGGKNRSLLLEMADNTKIILGEK